MPTPPLTASTILAAVVQRIASRTPARNTARNAHAPTQPRDGLSHLVTLNGASFGSCLMFSAAAGTPLFEARRGEFGVPHVLNIKPPKAPLHEGACTRVTFVRLNVRPL